MVCGVRSATGRHPRMRLEALKTITASGRVVASTHMTPTRTVGRAAYAEPAPQHSPARRRRNGRRQHQYQNHHAHSAHRSLATAAPATPLQPAGSVTLRVGIKDTSPKKLSPTHTHTLEEHTAASARGAHRCISSRSTQMPQLEEHTDASARGAHRCISSGSTQLHQIEERTAAPASVAHSYISSGSTHWHQLEEHTARGAPEQGSEAPTPLPTGTHSHG